MSAGAIKIDTHILGRKTYNIVEAHCPKLSATNFANFPSCHNHVLSIIALFITFFAICYSLHVRTTDGSSLCILRIKVLFVFLNFKLVRMASVKQFLIEVMLFAVALLGGWWGGDVVTL